MAGTTGQAALGPPWQRHVAALRQRLLWSACTVLAACVLIFPQAERLIAWLNQPYPDRLIFYAPAEAILAAIKVTLLGGIALAMPVMLYHLWKVIQPALLPQERRWGIPLLLMAWGFFALGVGFAHQIIVPLALQFMLQFGVDRSLIPQLGVGFYVDFNVKFLLVFGFAFELPLAVTLLSRLRVLTPGMLARSRRYAILGVLVLSAVLTPTADLFNLLLMAVPLMLLYEAGILSARLFGRPAEPDSGAQPAGTAGTREQ